MANSDRLRAGYIIYCSYGELPNANKIVAPLLEGSQPHKSLQQSDQGYRITDFPEVFAWPLHVKQFFIVPDGPHVVLREAEANKRAGRIRFVVLHQKGKNWVVRGIIEGPANETLAQAQEAIQNLCSMSTW